jgi:ABC-type iron transport system FetAB ATPase subunit
VLREQAVYRFGSDNRIAEMWINHDRRLFEQQFGKGS